MQFRGLFIVSLCLLLMSGNIYAAKRPVLCDEPGYACIKVKKGQSWHSLFPDERERGIVMRLNHTNGSLYPGKIIVVPDSLSYSDLLDHSPFPRIIEPPNEKLIIFDPKIHAWGAYDADGDLVRWGPATGGGSWCKDIGKSCRTKT